MSDGELKTSVVLDLTGNLDRRAQEYTQAIGQFSQRSQRQLSALQRTSARLGKTLDNITGRYSQMIIGAGAGYASLRSITESAKLDKQLIQIRQTAGATVEMANSLREELFRMAQETGQPIESLLQGFNNLIQAGLEWDKALATIGAINPAMAVTGSNADTLASALTVAAEAFDFDLSKPEKAVELLDKMTAAGRLGNAELEDLSSIFARVGVNADAAGLSFEETLGYIEQLSLIERNPERLATLADSTLRLFTNQKYLDNAQKVTGVNFYDANGGRRAPFEVLAEIAQKFQKLGTDQDRDKALSAAFGNVDLDTLKGLRTLLNGDALASTGTMTSAITESVGVIAKDLPDAISNSVDQMGRLKKALREAADEFAQPVNDVVENAIKFLLDEKDLSGKELLLGGGAAALLGFGALKGSGSLLKRLGGVGSGVVAGKVLEESAGVQPVFVVNMPETGLGGIGLPGGGGRVAGSGVLKLGGVGLAAIGGYGIGTYLNNHFLDGTEAGYQTSEFVGNFVTELGLNEFSKGRTSSRKAPRPNFSPPSDSSLLNELTQKRTSVGGRSNNAERQRGEVVVRVQAEQGTKVTAQTGRTDALDLEVETEHGIAAGGAW